MSPRLAIIAGNTLAALGLASLLEELMPRGEVFIYSSLGEMAEKTGASHNAADDPFVHYFITADTLLNHARFFLPRRTKTIVLVQGVEAASLPDGFIQIDVGLPREQLLRSLMTLHQRAHGTHGVRPHAAPPHTVGGGSGNVALTRRETDVLRLLVRGFSNKETAGALGVGLTTVITHRNNLTAKLGTRSLAALTIFAVSHGIVGVEEI